MEDKPCCMEAAARKIKQLEIDGSPIGLNQLDEAIREIRAMSLKNDAEIGEALMEKVRSSNYVPLSASSAYEKALLEEYHRSSKTQPSSREKQDMMQQLNEEGAKKMSKRLIIYEGMLCCSTGVCGAEPDKALIQLTEDVKKLRAEFPEETIIRASLSFDAPTYLENPEVLALVKKHGTGILPITVLGAKILRKQRYLTYEEMRSALLDA